MSLVHPKFSWLPERSDSGRRLRARNVAALTSAIVLCGGVAAYGSSSPQTVARNSKARPVKVTIAYTVPSVDQMLLPVTEAAGLFRKNGVDVTIKFLQSSLALPALVSNQVQFVVVGAPAAEVGSLSGQSLKFIGQWENVMNAEIVAGKSITSPKALNGKTVAISSSGALSDFLVGIADHEYGIKMHEVPLGSLPNQTAAYSHGSVDAISGTNVWQIPSLQAMVPGTHTVVDFRRDVGYPGAGSMIADGNWLKSKAHDATAVKVLTALYEGIHYFKTHSSNAIAITAKDTDEPAAEARAAYKETKPLYRNSIVPVLADQKNVLRALEPSYPNAKHFNPASAMDAAYAQQAEQAATSK